tara:strand:- start:117 stop:1061 length:945 start_codon:yes stop_codon:yes gene_type:complete
MSDNINKNVWLIGCGNISYDYVKILQDLNCNITAIGRSINTCNKFYSATGIKPHNGGINSFSCNNIPEYAIVATNESKLFDVTKNLIKRGIKNILIEKPGSIKIQHIDQLKILSIKHQCNLFIGYNRRFYQSVKTCKEIIQQTTGPISVNFNFTEWTHTIPFEKYTTEELSKFFLCNSSHVADTVFYLVGAPKKLTCYSYGELNWHRSGAIFQGSGYTARSAINYTANWISAGRWEIEIELPNKKLILTPLEELHIQHKGSIETVEYKLNNKIDLDYKPGLYEQVKSFFTHQKDLCTIEEQHANFKWYYDIAKY